MASPARIALRAPTMADQAEFVARAKASRALHGAWVSAPSTAPQFLAFLDRASQPANESFLVCERASGDIAGVINVSNIVLGAFRSGYLGYYGFAGYEGRGLMGDGLRAVLRHAFGKLKLHRLEANIQPGNAPSIALAKACGFAREGFSPRYLKIAGRWCDHERWAILADRRGKMIAAAPLADD